MPKRKYHSRKTVRKNYFTKTLIGIFVLATLVAGIFSAVGSLRHKQTKDSRADVVTQTVSLSPTEDANVKSAYPTTNYANASNLETSNYYTSNIRLSYLKFDLRNYSNYTLSGVSLVLTPTLERSVTKTVKLVTGSWTESTINWNNKPALGNILGTINLQTVKVGTPVIIELDTQQIQNYLGGTFSIGLDNVSGNASTLIVHSSESSTTTSRPMLNLTLTSTSTSTPTPTMRSSSTPTPTTTTSSASTPTPTSTSNTTSCRRPYTDSSPWNTRVTSPVFESYFNNSSFSSYLGSRTLGSNPDQYTYPVYEVRNSTSAKSMTISGVYSNVYNNGSSLQRTRGTYQVPIPDHAGASAGNDAQMIVINRDSGDEWGFYEASKNSDGTWKATNGYHYNTTWSGVPPSGFGSRGAGVTYLAGLIRPCEIARGYIDHAIAFAYDYPCSSSNCSGKGFPYFVYPGTKSDGKGTNIYDFPEGARLVLIATDTEINTWCGSNNTCKIIARALREYGMITIDNSGSAKIYPEANLTANWGTTLTRSTPNRIPLSKFKIIDF